MSENRGMGASPMFLKLHGEAPVPHKLSDLRGLFFGGLLRFGGGL